MKKVYFISLLSIISLNLFCQIHWTKHPDNPVMVRGASGEWDRVFVILGSVIYFDSTYHMWYNGSFQRTVRAGHATSPDGFTWMKDTNNPVLDIGPKGSWDENGVYVCSVLIIDSIFHMWYNGHTGWNWNINHRIGHATSLDGITWIKDTNNPVLDLGPGGDWDDASVWGGSVIYDGSEYHMWYNAYDGGPHRYPVGHATSPDGITWTKDPQNPVLTYEVDSWDSQVVDCPKVIFDGTIYHMWYSGGVYYRDGVKFCLRIGYATSEDGSSWTKYADNPVLTTGSEGSWDDKSVYWGSVIDSAGIKYKMWYTGSLSDETSSIGYAESDTRVPYLTVIDSKPVYDSADTLVAEIVLDGTIYIVPEGTIPVIDSILKYMVASVDASANKAVEIPLTDLFIDKYTILSVSSLGFVSTNQYLLEVVDNARSPELTLESNTVNKGDPITVESTKDGTIFLVPNNTPAKLSHIRMPFVLIDSLTAQANIPVEFLTTDLSVMDYWLYAVDIYGFISEPTTVTVMEEPGTGVEENINSEISIYPNPTNNILTIETNQPGQHFIEITSLNGQLLYGNKMEGPTYQIDLTAFQKGVCIITIRSRDSVKTEKIIKL